MVGVKGVNLLYEFVQAYINLCSPQMLLAQVL